MRLMMSTIYLDSGPDLPLVLFLLEDILHDSKSNFHTNFWNVPYVYIGDFLCAVSRHYIRALLLPSVLALLGWFLRAPTCLLK